MKQEELQLLSRVLKNFYEMDLFNYIYWLSHKEKLANITTLKEWFVEVGNRDPKLFDAFVRAAEGVSKP